MAADGTWQVTLETPMGAQEGTLVLQSAGTALHGTMSSPQGSLDITDGTVDGDRLTWKVKLPGAPVTFRVSATLDGDTITGTAKLGPFGDAEFQGQRACEPQQGGAR